MRQKVDKAGEIKKNNQGYLMKIIKYLEYHNILIKFLDDKGTIVKGDYSAFQKGMIKNPYHKTVYNIGCIGETDTIDNNKKRKKSYYCWKGMLHRCYDENFHKKQPTYKDCTVCEEWHCFANFEKWFNENYYEINNEIMQLDKDLLCHNLKLENKIYSPETCCFVPQSINNLFEGEGKRKENNLPKGITFQHKKYIAQFTIGKENNYLGRYNTPEEAFLAYKEFKESYIKQVADEYKSKYPQFPQRLYEAMYSYQVEITD